ncbi:alcohol dehydrogenase catalytic domain-containing protein [Draconibacterium sp. IB214405]|uniref:zinc-dependent alcohol dehydrogenase n=1 Tax=Draconibacterium sp. IB214405 TaxID=3097352 RepID=UPI002A11E554|nr:alcohol dehydrogenase catalytic domain-containing protein [Draconibacterium sp. IB214405]MDX8339452.1 alcohol dehydrogenase catalytic domain-containing protein [Draconibacterium sp. IB214405]
MKAVVLTGIRQMKLTEVPDPVLTSEQDVKIKLSTIGVCGSDIHYYAEGNIGSQVVEYPFTVGHECSGIIVEVGKDVNNVKVGDLVVVDPSVHCGTCDQCLAGRPHTCRNNKFLGCPGQLEGCLSEFIVMPSYTCIPVSDQLNAMQAALIEPLSIGVYAVKLAQMQHKESSTAILGAGPIGLSILMKLLADGVPNIGMIEPLDYRLDRAEEIGASWLVNPNRDDVEAAVKKQEELLMDIVFEASGDQQAVDNAIKILKPGGKLVLVGIPPDAQYVFNMDLMRRKELTIINVRRQNHCVEDAIDLVVSGKVQVSKMVTHEFNLEETPVAFDVVEGYKFGAIKAMINL